VKSLSLNNNRIEALVEQLYDINKRLISHEGRLLRLAESYGVAARTSSSSIPAGELDPKWVLRVSKLGSRGWKEFVGAEGADQAPARGDPQSGLRDRPGDPGVPPIVLMVQKGEREARRRRRR
jgi:RNA polymerase primary sigma factor